MAQLTPNMNLTVWNLPSDAYDYQQLADNFIKLDQHDHSGSGRGAPIDGSTGIKPGTIGRNQLGPNSVTSTAIQKNAINSDSIATGAIIRDKVGLSQIYEEHIANGAISTNKLASGSVTQDKLATSMVPKFISTKADLADVEAEDGAEIYFAANAANSIIWHLRYRKSVSRWEYLGGPPMTGRQNKNWTATSASMSNGRGDMKAITSVLFPQTGSYFVTGFVQVNALMDETETTVTTQNNASTVTVTNERNNPAVKLGLHFQKDAILKATKNDPWGTIPANQRTIAEFVKPTGGIDSPNMQLPISFSTIVNCRNTAIPLRLFASKNADLVSASFAKGFITAIPYYLNKSI